MPFEPVDAAGEQGAAHRDPQRDLGAHRLPVLGASPTEVGGDSHGHPVGLLALPLGDPPVGQSELRPPSVDLGGERLGIDITQIAQDRVDEGADGRRAHPRTLAAGNFEGPAQPTGLELLDLGR